MKKNILLFTFSLLFILSCNNEDQTLTNSDNSHIETYFTVDDLPKTFEVNGHKITIELEDSSAVDTRAYGPTVYAQGNMRQISNSEKLQIVRNCSPYQGIYLVSRFHFSNEIMLPSNASGAKLVLPASWKDSFRDANTQVYGAKLEISGVPGGTAASLSFQTLRIESTTGGQRIGQVFPTDGRTVKIPYQVNYD